MKFFNWRKKSIASFFTVLTVILILLQIGILISLLTYGGVFDHARQNAYKSFNDTVNNRRDYLKQEMTNRWTNMEPYLPGLAANLSKEDQDIEEKLSSAAPDLIRMLRSTGATGAYIILDSPSIKGKTKSALYLRDYDPLTNSSELDDVFVVYGPPEIAQEHRLPLDSTWQYYLSLNQKNKKFYEKPFQAAEEIERSEFLGYWSQPFQLKDDDIEVITYSLPLEDLHGEVVGVIGIELSLNYLESHLPMSDLQPRDSLGYVLTNKLTDALKMDTMVRTNNIQKRFLSDSGELHYDLIDEEKQMFKLSNHQTKDDILFSKSKLSLYDYKSPFQEEDWYVVGFVTEDYLLNYVKRIETTLTVIIVILLTVGVLSAIVISRQMSKPVIRLANQVVASDKTESISLEPTGLRELDNLSTAIVETNKLMVDSAFRLSRIIEMVGLPISAFEINKLTNQVVITGNIIEILQLPETCLQELKTKASFEKVLRNWLKNREKEDNIFKLPVSGDRWVRVEMNESEDYIYGLIEDVTEEVLHLKQIKRERDYDPLTDLLNRNSFKVEFEDWLVKGDDKVAALLMFDLDFLKVVNDNYGHKWGDLYICEAANSLREFTSPDRKILGRRSGDEFVMLLHGFTSREEIIVSLQAFYETLETYRLDFPNGEEREIKISAGLTWIDQDQREVNFDELLHEADEALYYSKENNKGTYTVYSEAVAVFSENE